MFHITMLFEVAGFCCQVYENCALLGYYAQRSANPLSTFLDGISVPSSRVRIPRRKRIP
jgi:hypothetical protein